MIKIGFWDNHLGERGTTIALYDYAYYNQTILKNKSYIFYDKNHQNNNQNVIQKFMEHFEVIGLEKFSDIDGYLKIGEIPILYNIKSGCYDGKISNVAKNIIHCVFSCDCPQGEVYCAISKHISYYNDKIPIIPHIVHLPYHEENMRKELNIPENATVFGRHGGKEQFDLRYVHNVVYQIAKNNSNVYFIFANTNRFCENLDNIIHIDTIVDLNEKRKFINTCDAMLWGRSDGETFGLSIGEFSICNKPVIATKIGYQAHVDFLKDKGLWYSNEMELIDIIKKIVSIDKRELRKENWNTYEEFSPENVMKKFNEIAILPLINKT